LREADISFARQVRIPIVYNGTPVGNACKADIVVAHELILKIGAVIVILSIHKMECRT
jgi:GxxExxY protein